MDEVTPTGIEGLDEVLGGGICTGNIVLVEGGSGTGKTTLAVEFIVNGAMKFGEPGIIVILEEHLEKLRKDMLKFNWDLLALEKRGLIKLFGLSPHSFIEMLKKDESPFLRTVRKLKAKRICVDSLTLLVEESSNPKEQRRQFSTLINALRREKLTGMLVIELPVILSANQYIIERSVVDSVFRLSIDPSPVGEGQVFRRFEVVKSRGQKFKEGLHSLKIGYSQVSDSLGIHIFPRFKSTVHLKENPSREKKRLCFGVPKLDALLNGGIFIGSSTLIAGPSGVGKSLLGLQFLLEGLKNGEAGCLVTMEENMSQIAANSATLNADLETYLKNNSLTIKLSSPLEMDMDEHIYDLVRVVQERQIKRLVLDPASAYKIAMRTDPARYKDYLYALLVYFKNEGITTVITSEVSDLGISSHTPTNGISFIVDNILILRYLSLQQNLRKAIYVLKSRGSDHQKCICEYTIGKSGIEIKDINPDALSDISPLKDLNILKEL
jgi:circadian clock protein KaiC